MRRSRLALAFVLLAALVLSVAPMAADKTRDKGQGTGDKKKSKDLVVVELEGVTAFPHKILYEAVGIKAPVFEKLFHRQRKAERATLDATVQQVTLFYQRRGYFEATTRIETRDQVAVIHVDEGKPCTVGPLKMVFDPGEPPEGPSAKDLAAGLPLVFGAAFTVADYENAAQMVLDRLREDGRPFSEISPEAEADLASRSVAVLFTVKPDERLTVGDITFEGAVHVEEKVLRRALALKPGKPYRLSEMEASRLALYRLGLFNSVAILPVRGAKPGTVDVHIRLAEGLQNKVRFGAGYGTDEGPRVQGRWETLRIQNHAAVTGVEAKVSGLEDLVTTYFRRPYVFDGQTTFLSDLTLGRRHEVDFTYRSLKVQFGFQREFSKRVLGSAFVVVEKILQFTPNQSLDDALAAGDRQVATMASVAGTITYRTTDDPLDPTHGMLASAFAEPTRVVGNGVTFTRMVVEDRHYFGLGADQVFALRFKVGAIQSGAPASQIPLTRLFYAGGSNSIRGYAYDSLGPLAPDGALLGGEGLLEASVEYRFPLKGDFKGVAFVDAGNAFRKPLQFEWDNIYAGTGVGVRYKTPVGPVGLDFAWKLRKDPNDSSPYMIHFFIGYAF